MTITARITAHRSFARLSRTQMQATIATLEADRDRAIGQARATRDRVGAWLENAAAMFDEDAAHMDRIVGAGPKPGVPLGPLTAGQRRAVADAIRQCAVDWDHA